MALSRDSLTLLTLNAHSLMEADNAMCLRTLAQAIVRERVDVVALQEVNQSKDAPLADEQRLVQSRFVPCDEEKPVRCDNYALALARLLEAQDERFYWTWGFAHLGYRVYEEGVALLSRAPITGVRSACVSAEGARCRRKIVGVRTQALQGEAWFYTAHMGWWKDEEDPFAAQWERLLALCGDDPAYLMGDFNSPAHVRGEGYDLMTHAGFTDLYMRARSRDAGATVGGQIDGWRKGKVDPMRIDFAFSNRPGHTARSRVIFDGAFYPVISDHFGVLTHERL